MYSKVLDIRDFYNYRRVTYIEYFNGVEKEMSFVLNFSNKCNIGIEG